MIWARLTRDHRFLQMMRALYIPSLWFRRAKFVDLTNFHLDFRGSSFWQTTLPQVLYHFNQPRIKLEVVYSHKSSLGNSI